MWFQTLQKATSRIKSEIPRLYSQYGEVLRYIVIGVLTTLVGYVSFYYLAYVLLLEPNLSNFISINLAILFAFITNKGFVFRKKSRGMGEWWLEAFKFYASRGVSMVVEIVGLWLIIELLRMDPMIGKVVLSVVVVVLNYFLSKFLVFK